MTRLLTSRDVLTLKPSKADLMEGAAYAAITLPWTFNRMSKNSSINGLRERALNIAKGIVGQAVLRRHLKTKGVAVESQQKSHRAEDLFDFRLTLGGKLTTLDVKTLHVYTNYPGDLRDPFTPSLVIDNKAYDGPEWRHFFPMLVAHTQMSQQKEAYTFAIATSIDPRQSIDAKRSQYVLTAFPYGPGMPFFNGRKLVAARETAGKGFFVGCEYVTKGLFRDPIDLKLVGEWDGKSKQEVVSLPPDKRSKNIGPFSCLSAIQVDKDNYDKLHGTIELDVGKNEMTKSIYNSSMANINEVPDVVLEFKQDAFTNLVLPDDYELNFLGWIPKTEFVERCTNYRSWVWPLDSKDKTRNQPWSQMTERDRRTLAKLNLTNRIQKGEHRVAAGILKGTGLGGGTNCYVYPNGFGGGLQETNLYVLPQDLRKMDSLWK